MHAVLTCLTAVALVIHAFVGCCWHHGHGCTNCDGLATAAAHDAACCDDGDDDHQEQKSHNPCKCALKCQGMCTYLSPQKQQIEFPGDVLTFLAPRASALSGRQFSGASRGELPSPAVDRAPPMRLHLLEQVLLI